MQDIMVRTNTERDSDRVGQRERERDRLHCKSVWQRIARSPGDCVIYGQADQGQHVSTGSCPDHPSLNWTWSNPLAALTAPRQCSASFASPFNNEFMRHGEWGTQAQRMPYLTGDNHAAAAVWVKVCAACSMWQHQQHMVRQAAQIVQQLVA